MRILSKRRVAAPSRATTIERHRVRCWACNGSGQRLPGRVCLVCGGRRVVTAMTAIDDDTGEILYDDRHGQPSC